MYCGAHCTVNAVPKLNEVDIFNCSIYEKNSLKKVKSRNHSWCIENSTVDVVIENLEHTAITRKKQRCTRFRISTSNVEMQFVTQGEREKNPFQHEAPANFNFE